MGFDEPVLIDKIRNMTDSEVDERVRSLSDLLNQSGYGMEKVRVCYIDILNTKHNIDILGGNYCNPCPSTRNKAFLYALCLYSNIQDPAKLLK